MLPSTYKSLIFLCLFALSYSAAPSTSSPHSLHVGMMMMDQPMDAGHEGHDHTKMDMGNDTGHDMSMAMYFHFGVKETVLFADWKITNAGGMVASVIGIFILGMLYEGLKYYREHLFKKYVSSIQFSTVAITGESGKVNQVHKVESIGRNYGSIIKGTTVKQQSISPHRMLSYAHAIQTALHVIQIVVSYFLMLIFMTYNGWLCIAVVLGSGFGYFVFGWRKASVVDITEHCH